jgi:hypothetical protein
MSDCRGRSEVQARTGREGHPIPGRSDPEFELFGMIGRGPGTGEIARRLRHRVKTIETCQAKPWEKLALAEAATLFGFALHWVESRSGSAPPLAFPWSGISISPIMGNNGCPAPSNS